MAQLLRQSTEQSVVVGPIITISDGSPGTGVSFTFNSGLYVSKAADDWAATGGDTDAEEIGNGFYRVNLSSGLCATVGTLDVIIQVANYYPHRSTFQVVEEAVYDALYASGAAGLTPVSASTVAAKRTWYADGYRARNIVEVTAGFDGTLALVPDLNPDTTISTVSTVTFDGPASVTASNLTVRTDKKAVHFDTPALSTVGTYTVTVTVVTVDSQTIVTTGTLKVI